MMMDDEGRPIKVDGCSPTDKLGYVFFTDGMRRRLGDHAVPFVALLDQHVRWIDKHMEAIYQGATTSKKKQEVCRVALVNLFGWLGWLRGSELFSLIHCDVDTIQPADFATQARFASEYGDFDTAAQRTDQVEPLFHSGCCPVLLHILRVRARNLVATTKRRTWFVTP
jgi:hypothetical protein